MMSVFYPSTSQPPAKRIRKPTYRDSGNLISYLTPEEKAKLEATSIFQGLGTGCPVFPHHLVGRRVGQ
jgi:hypothetical protein